MIQPRVLNTIERYRMLAPGQRVGVAVSGGADSVCLLHLLVELAPRWDLQLRVLHVDHGLRGAESKADAGFVRELAARFELPFFLEEVNLSEEGNLEQAARHARLGFFRRLLAEAVIDRVAVGHTRSDQAETVLFRFLRGAGTAGLAGIRPVTREGIIRPLLEIDRIDTAAYLGARGVPWREDSMNQSLQFARNRIRRDLLPQLEREWNPSLAATLAHMAEWAQGEEEFWRETIDRLAAEHLLVRGGAVLIDVRRLAALPEAAARRLLRRAIECVKGDLRGIEFRHAAAILTLALSAEGHGRAQAPGIDAFRSFEWLRLAAPRGGGEERNYRFALAVPGHTPLPRAGSVILAEIIENSVTNGTEESVYNSGMGCVDWARLSGRLEVRNWRPGDQYQPIGQTGEHKIKSLFQHARIPLWERRDWPVVTDGEAIVWSRQFGPAAALAPDASTKVVLRIRESAGIGLAADGV